MKLNLFTLAVVFVTIAGVVSATGTADNVEVTTPKNDLNPPTDADTDAKNHLRGLGGGPYAGGNLPEELGEGCGNGASWCPQGFVCDTTNFGNPDGSRPICRKCGGDGESCCAGNTCTQGLACGAGGEGLCGPCGTDGETCCADNYCEEDLVCDADGTCTECGEPGLPCCEGRKCFSQGTVCMKEEFEELDDFFCVLCGAEGEPCCDDETCNPGYGCGNYEVFSGDIEETENTQCIPLGDLAYPCNPDGSCALPGFVCEYPDSSDEIPAICVICGTNGQPCCDGFACNNGQTCDLFNRADGEAPVCEDCGDLDSLCCLTEEPQNRCGNGLTCVWDEEDPPTCLMGIGDEDGPL
mmetsp:Transcript_6701/g.14707  ORF Transcript_6701/g.14707 Transcript_6701/m.14707 type:complete len:353 (-) Transcript_6701:381-1439(-)